MATVHLRIITEEPPPRSAVNKAIGRGGTMSGRLTGWEREEGESISHPEWAVRPKTRGDCENVPRPCPWVSCRHNLYLDVLAPQTDRWTSKARGWASIKINFPELEPDEMVHSCALDLADTGGITLQETGDVLNLSRERVRQLEAAARRKGSRSRKLRYYTEP